MSFASTMQKAAEAGQLLGEGLDAIEATVKSPVVAGADAVVKVVTAVLDALAGYKAGQLTADEARTKFAQLDAELAAGRAAARAITNS